MMLFLLIWVLSGIFYFVKYTTGYSVKVLGILGTIFVALPFCIVFGPIYLVAEFINEVRS